ncbi:MAG: hypothetical protein M1840_008436 [Geoglossum simile]|nr:MAG: hypothetical protein M1840_008436 [Geoglossum simile]
MDIAHRFLITPAPTPPALYRRAETTLAYPACRDDPNGPCMEITKSSDSCVKEFPTSSFYHQMYCRCTNGYYSRSSECYNDCYRAPSIDTAKISRDDKLQSVECESYSLAMESDEAFWSSVSARETSRSSSSSKEVTSGLSTARNNVTQIATPETLGWTERQTPTPTSPVQQGGGVGGAVTAARYKALVVVVVMLALIPGFYGL